MSSPAARDDSSASFQHEPSFHETCDQFEAAWKAGGEPQIEKFLGEFVTAEPSQVREVLHELVAIDLEYRWRSNEEPSSVTAPPNQAVPAIDSLRLPARRLLEDYAARFPQLGPLENFPLELIKQEYRVRCLYGNRPSPAEYDARFSGRPDVVHALHESEAPAPKPPPQAFRLNCPHCHSPIEVLTDAEEEILCPSCGSTFRLDNQRTRTWSKDKLPKLGKFELLNRLGFGAFGTVYKAYDSELKRSVALKLPRSGTIVDKEDEKQFLREARSAAELRHPGIVPIFEVGRSQHFLYIVSELVDGITLADALTARRLSFRESAELVAQVAEALDYSHKQGVVHRDLKPSNIMLASDGKPRIVDFGLAKRETGGITMNLDGQVLGTPTYMSPEQASGNSRQADGRSDVYSLGVILFELLTGELPFRGNQRMLMHQVMHDEPRAPRSLNDRIPRDLETICLKAMAKEPERRYAKAADFAADLKRYLEGQPILARPVGKIERAWRWCNRNPVVTGLLGAVLLSLATGAIVSILFAVRASQREADAIAEWTRAEEEKSRAESQKARADRKAAEALAEKKRAEKELLRAECLLYAHQFASAQHAWEADDVPAALKHLEACRADFRGWEHDYLFTLLHQNHQTLELHTAAVTDVALSVDGTRLVSGSFDRTAKVCDISGGQATLTLNGHTRRVRGVAFSRDGRRIVTGSADRTLKVWDAMSGQEIRTLEGHAGGVECVSFSSDADRIVSGGLDNTIKVWNAVDGQELLTLKGHRGAVESVSFSPDGELIVSASLDQTVKVWEAMSGQLTLTLKGHADTVKCADFSPDANQVVSGSFDHTIKVWDLSSGRETKTLAGHHAGVSSVAFTADGHRIISGGLDRLVKVWDAQTGQQIVTFKGHTGAVTSVSLSADGKRIATGSDDKTVRIWDATGTKETLTLKAHSEEIEGVVFRGDRSVVSASRDNTLKFWDLKTAHNTRTLGWLGYTVLGRARLAADWKLWSLNMPETGQPETGQKYSPAIKVWDGKQYKHWKSNLRGSSEVASAAFCHDGAKIAFGLTDGSLAVGTPVSFEKHRGLIQPGDLLLSDLQVFKKEQGMTSGRNSTGIKSTAPTNKRSTRNEAIGRVAWSTDGKRIVSGAADGTIRIWDSITGEVTLTLPQLLNGECNVAFSPDGKQIAGGSVDNALAVYDVMNGSEILVLKGHAAKVTIVAYSKDGKRIVTGSMDHTLRVWDAVSGQELLTLKGHTGQLTCIVFSGNGGRMASVSDDRTIRVWDASTTMPIESPAREP